VSCDAAWCGALYCVIAALSRFYRAAEEASCTDLAGLFAQVSHGFVGCFPQMSPESGQWLICEKRRAKNGRLASFATL